MLLKKIMIMFAGTSLALSPVVASAAPAMNDAISTTAGQSELEGGSWLAILLGLAIIAGGVWLVADGDDDPVSP